MLPFSKGFRSGQLLDQALRIAPSTARQVALDTLQRTGFRKLICPSAGIFSHIPSHILELKPPADDSRQMAGYLAELGAMALLKNQLPSEWDPKIVRELSRFDGLVDTLGPFRLPGDTIAGYTTKFAQHNVNFGWSRALVSPWATLLRLGDYGTTENTHSALMQGSIPEQQQYNGPIYSLQTLQHYASFAHVDQPFLAPLFWSFQLLDNGAQLSSRFPTLTNETGFVTHGGPVDVQCAIAEVTRLGMEWTWKLKGQNCRARPEQLWPLAAAGELHPDLWRLAPTIMQKVGKYLPQSYAEAAPLHMTWPSGHATIGAATVTLLCAYYKDQSIPAMGITSLHAELRHAAWLMLTLGRMAAGVHYRSDCIDGIKVGEEAAIYYIKQRRQFEPLKPVQFTGFFGRKITV